MRAAPTITASSPPPTAASGQELQNWDFYMALAYFKLAIIAAGIDFRGRESGDAPAAVGEAVAPLIAEGLRLV